MPHNPLSSESIAFFLLMVLVVGSGGMPPSAAAADELPGELVDDPIQRVGAWPFGPSYAVEADRDRDLAFLGAGGVVMVIDVSDPTAPSLITDLVRTVGLVEDLAYDAVNQRLFIACGEGGLEIWDVATPASPARLSVTEVLYLGYDTPVGHVELYQHFAIVECSWGYVHSLDVSDPTHPVQVSFNGLMGNPARDIHVSEDGQVHTSGAQRYQRLAVFADGSLHGSGAKDFDYGPYAVFGTSEVAYVGYGGYIFILDLLYPGFPPWSYFDAGGVGGLEVADGIAYIINGIGLRLYDVSVHNNPFYLGTLTTDMSFYDLALAGSLVYVAAGVDGLRVVDVSDPTNPIEIGAFEDVYSVTWKSLVVGSYALLAHDSDGVLVVDISDQENPELAGSFPTSDAVRDIAVSGDRMYVAASDAGLRIADITDPTAPVEIGALDTSNAWRLEPVGDVVYVVKAIANQPYELYAVDVSDPAAPVQLGTMQFPGLVWDLIADGDHLYVAGHDDGVRIVDISTPGAPVGVGAYSLPSVTELDIQDGLLYVASHTNPDGGLYILDLTDPVALTEVGRYQAPGFAVFHVDVQGNYAAVSEGTDLHLMYVADPTNPVDRDGYTMPGGLVGITMDGPSILVSDADAGLQIVKNMLFDDPGGGLQWEPVASGTAVDLHSVCFADAGTGWAVGEQGTILATTDAGDSWQPQTSGTSAALLDLDCVDPLTAWAVGVGGVVLATTDGGASWAPQSSGTSVLLRSVSFVDDDHGWAVGDDGTIVHTTDGGASWQPQTSGTTIALNGVSFVDPLHGWIASGDFGTVLRTTDGGASWQSTSTGSTAILLDIDFADASHGWAVGMFGEVVATSDGGLSWNRQTTPHPPEWLYATHFIDPDHGWAVGFDGRVLATVDGGTSWQAQSSGVHVQLEGVHFAHAHLGWAVGEQGTIVRALAPAGSTLFADGFESGGTAAWSSTMP